VTVATKLRISCEYRLNGGTSPEPCGSAKFGLFNMISSLHADVTRPIINPSYILWGYQSHVMGTQSHVMRSPTAISEFLTLLTNTRSCSRSSRNGSRPRSGTLWLRILYMLERPPAHPPIRLLIGGRAPLPGSQLRRPLGKETYVGET